MYFYLGRGGRGGGGVSTQKALASGAPINGKSGPDPLWEDTPFRTLPHCEMIFRPRPSRNSGSAPIPDSHSCGWITSPLRSGDVIHSQLWESGSGYETTHPPPRPPYSKSMPPFSLAIHSCSILLCIPNYNLCLPACRGTKDRQCFEGFQSWIKMFD